MSIKKPLSHFSAAAGKSSPHSHPPAAVLHNTVWQTAAVGLTQVPWSLLVWYLALWHKGCSCHQDAPFPACCSELCRAPSQPDPGNLGLAAGPASWHSSWFWALKSQLYPKTLLKMECLRAGSPEASKIGHLIIQNYVASALLHQGWKHLFLTRLGSNRLCPGFQLPKTFIEKPILAQPDWIGWCLWGTEQPGG